MDSLIIRKLLLNNYLLLTFISYIYLLYKINNNHFKELITYIIVLFLFYIYFKDLKKSYIFAFFVLLIRLIFKNLFNNIENFNLIEEEEEEDTDSPQAIEKDMDETSKNLSDNDNPKNYEGEEATMTEDEGKQLKDAPPEEQNSVVNDVQKNSNEEVEKNIDVTI